LIVWNVAIGGLDSKGQMGNYVILRESMGSSAQIHKYVLSAYFFISAVAITMGKWANG